ncbi:hypothetical protein CONLIGDRAFT_636979 [Coniochaeta ligniaria NRRL 30616]|uniref:Uncharacterized protein n=1 Tax=Coniochaeta ligniaria NRRL 30616 TaxID=1408157 RepID=A0A1J7IT65_9PEZI|nr:hypothetical protein CONLIGDRAFT_636979 [Coniochaeta ligniaria NRRL 30616]
MAIAKLNPWLCGWTAKRVPGNPTPVQPRVAYNDQPPALGTRDLRDEALAEVCRQNSVQNLGSR